MSLPYQPTLFDGEPIQQTVILKEDDFGRLVSWMKTPRALNATIPATRLVRTTDPDTAHQAATKASKRGPSQRRRVWEALTQLGTATDYELAIATGILRSSAAKRRQELQDLGHVHETPQRRATDTGTMAIVWRCSYLSAYSGK